MKTFYQLETEIERYEKSIFEQRRELQALRDEVEKLRLQAELEQLKQAEEQWEPVNGETYWSIDADGNVNDYIWLYCPHDHKRFAIGNVFSTEEEGTFEIKRRQVITKLSEYASDYVKDEKNWTFYWNYVDQKITFTWTNNVQYPIMYFSSKEVAEEAIKTVGAERVKKYYLGVK